MPISKMLNIGCGAHHHPDWINLDVSPTNSNVIAIDINKGLPFASKSVGVCYSSHVLEHLDKAHAKHLIAECFRVLEPGGTIRLVVPDLEALAREYLRVLDAVASGDKTRGQDYEWVMLELYDQIVRTYPGGEMANFLKNIDEENKPFVRSRIGAEAEQFWPSQDGLPHASGNLTKRLPVAKLFKLARERLAGYLIYLIAGKVAAQSFRSGLFRSSGEIHQWMYDRYSLERLLSQAGFVDIKVCAADKSRIARYKSYNLDILNGAIRKPDSLYIEASTL